MGDLYEASIPHYHVPPIDTDGWMDGQWDGYDRDATQEAADDLLRDKLREIYPGHAFVVANTAQPSFQGWSVVGRERADAARAEREATAVPEDDPDEYGPSGLPTFGRAYDYVFTHPDEWLVAGGVGS